MTEREKLDFWEFKRDLYFKRGGLCEVCGEFVDNSNYQLGHRIPQSYLKALGKDIIHHELNLALVCGLACNKKVDIGCNPAEVHRILTLINDEIMGDGNG